MNEPFFNASYLRALRDQIDAVRGEAVSITKPVARAMVFELIRFYEQQSNTESGRVELVQKLTFEYACQHINDLLRSVLDNFDSSETHVALNYAMAEISRVGALSQLQTAGKA